MEIYSQCIWEFSQFSPILIFYCGIKITKTYQLKTVNMCYLTISAGQYSGSGLLVSTAQSLTKLQSRCLLDYGLTRVKCPHPSSRRLLAGFIPMQSVDWGPRFLAGYWWGVTLSAPRGHLQFPKTTQFPGTWPFPTSPLASLSQQTLSRADC